tara:strand:+ start:863 stop:1360 length:498 start_codon:yes stop_codon:yes gene_type:complete
MSDIHSISKTIIPSIVVIFVGIAFKTFHGHYLERRINHDRALLYLSSDVCKNAKLRIQLGSYARCSQSEKELSISPFLHSIYDLLEDYWVCGHDKCSAFQQWIIYNKFLLCCVFCFIVYIIYQYYMFRHFVFNTRTEALPIRRLTRQVSFQEMNDFDEEYNEDSI